MGVAKVPTKQLGAFKATVIQTVACDSTVYVGALVRIDSGTGDFVNALADTPTNARVVGMCVAKSSSTVCDVLLPGSLTEAIFIGLNNALDYFLSDITPGAITASFPTASGAIILNVGRPYTTTKLFFNPLLAIRRAL